MITTTRMLCKELQKLEDDFIIVKDENDREYIIESITRTQEGLRSKWCLKIRDGGSGYIKQ